MGLIDIKRIRYHSRNGYNYYVTCNTVDVKELKTRLVDSNGWNIIKIRKSLCVDENRFKGDLEEVFGCVYVRLENYEKMLYGGKDYIFVSEITKSQIKQIGPDNVGKSVAVVVELNNKLVTVSRVYDKKLFGFITGGVYEKESTIDAAWREASEELDIDEVVLKELGVMKLASRENYIYANIDHYVSLEGKTNVKIYFTTYLLSITDPDNVLGLADGTNMRINDEIACVRVAINNHGLASTSKKYCMK